MVTVWAFAKKGSKAKSSRSLFIDKRLKGLSYLKASV
jgi:hypothetical protein